MIISVDTEEAFNKIQHSFMIKILQKVGLEGAYPDIIKAIYDNSTANTTVNGEKHGQTYLNRQKTYMLKTIRHWWKKSKMTQTDGEIFHVLELE